MGKLVFVREFRILNQFCGAATATAVKRQKGKSSIERKIDTMIEQRREDW